MSHLLKTRTVGAGAGNFSFKRDLGSKVKEDHLRVCWVGQTVALSGLVPQHSPLPYPVFMLPRACRAV